ncbi:hypothetical protein CO666_06790 [Rhizobium chutanense]|uniref:Uncharacterized protein n=1 Tax=Rhizobium chutanense TaxID=2035448 RepID=A0A2A6JHE2_9HYPH|nr:hypothetical protein CO666_06790 [Rhizobium chutanense]
MLVTGIQPRRVRAVNESFPPLNESPAPKDLGALDSCDKHRNEGGGERRVIRPAPWQALPVLPSPSSAARRRAGGGR